MTSEESNDKGASASGVPGDDGDNPVDVLLDALLSDTDSSLPDEPPTIGASTRSDDASDLEEGIVSSLLDDLMSSVPGSSDPDFTEGATAIPFSPESGSPESPDGPGASQAPRVEPFAPDDPTLAIAALAGNEDPTAAVEAFIDPEPTSLIDLPDTDGEETSVVVGSEDPTAIIDAPTTVGSEDPTAIIDAAATVGSEDPTAIIDAAATEDLVAPDESSPSVEVSTDGSESDTAADATTIMASSAAAAVTDSPDATEVMPTPAETDLESDLANSASSSTVATEAAEATIVDTSDDQTPPSVDERRDSSRRPASGGGRRVGSVLALCAVGLVGLLGAAWAIDTLSNQGKVLRGTTYAGESIQGLSETDLEELLDTRTAELANQPMDVTIGDVTVNSDPVTLGVSLDRETIIDDALGAGRDGFILFRPVSWLGRFFSSQDIDERYSYDSNVTTEAAETILLAPLNQVKEPELTYEGTAIGVERGAIGTTVDAGELVDALPSTMDSGSPYQVSLAPIDQTPALTDEQVEAVADEINDTTAEPLALRVLDDVAVVESDQLRAWSKLVNEGDGEAAWALDTELAQTELQPLFPSLGSEDQQAKFAIVDDEPTIIPASETVICCAEDSAERIRDGLNEPPLELSEEELEELENDDPTAALRVVSLEPITVGADEGVAELESLGIIEEVSTFTSNHACCQNRVTNIQRFADLMQGAIIRPGESISLNGHVGQRTREKGFVADGAINLGVLEPQVGGGISQYATTFFNASFFAGLEFIEYQSHSLYISRYPRGREATISWRRPDLEVKNNTPYGILVWNTYTPTSITVTFYSTKHLEVEALPLRRASERQCRVDITPRLITFEDGTEVEDSVYAVYRPGEGLDCNGNSTRPDLEPEPASTTPTTTQDTDGDQAAGVTTTVPANDDGIDDAITTTVAEDPNGDT